MSGNGWAYKPEEKKTGNSSLPEEMACGFACAIGSFLVLSGDSDQYFQGLVPIIEKMPLFLGEIVIVAGFFSIIGFFGVIPMLLIKKKLYHGNIPTAPALIFGAIITIIICGIINALKVVMFG